MWIDNQNQISRNIYETSGVILKEIYGKKTWGQFRDVEKYQGYCWKKKGYVSEKRNSRWHPLSFRFLIRNSSCLRGWPDNTRRRMMESWTWHKRGELERSRKLLARVESSTKAAAKLDKPGDRGFPMKNTSVRSGGSETRRHVQTAGNDTRGTGMPSGRAQRKRETVTVIYT